MLHSFPPHSLVWFQLIQTLAETKPVSEFNEFEPRLKSAKNRFHLSVGLHLEKLNFK